MKLYRMTFGALTDSDDTEAHSGGILNRKMTKTSTGAREDDPVTNLSLRVLDSAVDGNTLQRQ